MTGSRVAIEAVVENALRAVTPVVSGVALRAAVRVALAAVRKVVSAAEARIHETHRTRERSVVVGRTGVEADALAVTAGVATAVAVGVVLAAEALPVLEVVEVVTVVVVTGGALRTSSLGIARKATNVRSDIQKEKNLNGSVRT